MCNDCFEMKIIDAHSHIDYITHRYQVDVVGTVCCTVDEFQWDILEDMVSHSNKIYAAFGIHPWRANFVDAGFDMRLESLLKTNRNFMVGEIGLDKNKPDMDKQIDVFIKQFEVAVRLKRSVFIHCVGAWDKILHILKQYKKSDLPIIVFHAFNASDDILNYLLMLYENVMFSFGKNALYGKNCRIQQIPIDKILVESDENRDVILKDIVDKIAVIKNNTNASDIIYDNTQRVLKNGQVA